MKSVRARSFSNAGKVSRGALLVGGALAMLSGVSAVVVAHAGTTDEHAVAIDAGRHVLAAVASWQTANSDGCPTITELVEAGQLDRDARTDDPWGNRYRIVCEGVHAAVRSAGPDRRSGTPDDVTIRDDG
jgi:general secretion pathway protein G